MAKGGAGQAESGASAIPSLADLFEAMGSWGLANRRFAALAAAAAFLAAVLVTLLIPRDCVATMVVTPVESSLTDPSALMTTPGFSIRAPLSLTNGPPPQMAAFIKLLKSPEVARKLTRDARAMQAIDKDSASRLGAVLGAFSKGAPDEAAQIRKVLNWLSAHIAVDQDIDVRTWTITLRYPSSEGAVYLLTQVHAAAEDILRGTAIAQFKKEKEFGISFLNITTDAQERQIIYGILGSIDRSLLVLRSGANVATIVISSPYAPDSPTYPPRVMVFLIVLGSLIFLLFATLFAHCYRSVVRGHRVRLELAPAAADI
jgi:hypothetical protein